MSRLPNPGQDNGTWGVILNDYLGNSLTSSGLLKENSVSDTQVSSISQSKISGLTSALTAKADRVGQKFSKTATIVDPTASTLTIWQATFDCVVTKVSAYRVGGTGATINALKNGSNTLLVADLSVSVAATWMAGGTLHNTSVALGDALAVTITGVSAAPTQIVIQIDLETT